jgi:hypothetical protein
VQQDLIAKLTHGRERRKHVKRLRLNLLAQDTYTKDNASVHLEVHSRIDEISIPCMNPLHLHHAPFSLWIVAIMRMIGHHLREASPWLTLVDTSIKATRAKRVVHERITASRRELTISHLVACIHCIRCSKFSLRERLAPRYRGSKQRP